MRANWMLLLAASVVMVLLVWRGLQPYPMPVAQSLIPPDLPVHAKEKSEGALSILMSRNLWDKNRGQLLGKNEVSELADKAKLEATDSLWRLVGITQKGQQPLALVSSGSEIKTYQSGELLPDGATIIKIDSNAIQIMESGNENSVYLFVGE